MLKLARTAAVAATIAMTGITFATTASANSTHNYTCSNQGGGPNHTVNCAGLITVNNVLDNTTVNISDINVLNNTQLGDLQVALANVSDNDVNLPVDVQLLDLQKTVVNTYLSKFGIVLVASDVNVCAAGVCV